MPNTVREWMSSPVVIVDPNSTIDMISAIDIFIAVEETGWEDKKG